MCAEIAPAPAEQRRAANKRADSRARVTGCWGLALPAVEKLLLLEDELEALPLGLIF
jgi:hypothetical protein